MIKENLWKIIYTQRRDISRLRHEIVLLVHDQTNRSSHDCRKALKESNWSATQAIIMLNQPRLP